MLIQENGAEGGWGPLGDFNQVEHRQRDVCVCASPSHQEFYMRGERGKGEGVG